MRTTEYVGLTHLRHRVYNGVNAALRARRNVFKLTAPSASSTEQPNLALPPVKQSILQVPTVVQPTIAASSPASTQTPPASSTQQSFGSSSSGIGHVASVAWMPDQTTILMSSSYSAPITSLATASTLIPSFTSSALVPAQHSSAVSSLSSISSDPVSLAPIHALSTAVITSSTDIIVCTSTAEEVPMPTSTPFQPGVQNLSSKQKAELFTGVSFGAIAGIALLVVFVAWLLKVRKRGSGLCLFSGSQVENGDASTPHINRFLGGLSHSPPPFGDVLGMEEIPLDAEKARDVVGSNGAPVNMAFNLSPYPTRRPLPVHFRSADTHTPQVLGALKVTNLLPGDACSISISSQPATRFSSAVDLPSSHDSAGAQLSEDLGTPRESCPGEVPRYLTLGGNGLTVPWKGRTMTPTFDQNNHHSDAETKSFDTLPLPFSPSPVFGDKTIHQDHGWGTTLRSNFFNAISTMKRREFWSTSTTGARFNGDSLPRPSDAQVEEQPRDAIMTSPLDWFLGVSTGSGLGIRSFDDINEGGPVVEREGCVVQSSTDGIQAPRVLDNPPHLPLHDPSNLAEETGNKQVMTCRDFFRRTTSDQSTSTLESTASSLELTDRELLVKRVISARRMRRKNMSISRLGTGSSQLRGGGSVLSRKSIKGGRPLKKKL